MVKSRSHNVAHLPPPTNVPTKYLLPTPYGFRDIAWARFLNPRSLRQSQRWKPWGCMSTPPNQCPYQVSISYTLQFEIQPGQTFSCWPPTCPSGYHWWKQYPDSPQGLWGNKNFHNALAYGRTYKITRQKFLSQKVSKDSRFQEHITK